MGRGYWSWGKIGLTLLVCLLCITGSVSSVQAAKITGIDDSEDIYFYPVDFGDTGMTFMIPMPYTKAGMTADEADYKQLIAMTDAKMAEPFFLLSALRDEGLAKKALKDFSQADLRVILLKALDISDKPIVIAEAFGPEIPAIGVTFTDKALGQHLIGLREGWVMVLSLLPGSETADYSGLDDYEDILFRYMVTPYIGLPKVQTIALTDSQLSLTLPEGMEATVDRYDEYTDQEMVVYHVHPPKPNDKTIVLTMTTIRKALYAGKRLQDLEGGALNEVASRFIGGFGEVRSEWLGMDEDYPMLLIHEIGSRVGEHKNSDAYHMLLMKDGWLFGTTFIDMGIWPLAESLTMQVRFMQSMLAGDGQVPVLGRQSISYPTLNGKLAFDVPFGYAPMLRHPQEGVDQYILTDLQGSGKAYIVVFNTRVDFGAETIANRLEKIQQQAGAVEVQSGQKVTLEQVESGYLGVPTIVTCTVTKDYVMAYFMKDGCLVNLGVQSPSQPLFQGEVDQLADLIRFVEAQE